jgi:hypothetical protein
MPRLLRPARPLVAALLALVALGSLAAPAAALEPPQPLPGYRPAFVTETDTRPWKDCLWASGSMLLDKWTNGATIVGRQELRRLSGDRHGGSTLADLHAAFERLGLDLRYSPDGGARITWRSLLNALSHGAGAVLLGDDSKLPRWYGRWDVAFWQATGDGDNHAVYIERYDPKHGRVWLMDPLGRGDWAGEWISVRSLRRFAWSNGGYLSAAITPTAKPAPYAEVSVGDPTTVISPTTLDVRWEVKAPRGWHFPGADVKVAFPQASDPLALAVSAPAIVSDVAIGDAPASPGAAVANGTLRAIATLPTEPGAYQATMTLTDRRFGKTVAASGDVAVFVPGSRRATLGLVTSSSTVIAGAQLDVTVSVANSGEDTWADGVRAPGDLFPIPTIRHTQVIARWIPVELVAASTADAGELPPPDEAPAEAVIPSVAELGLVPLAPGGAVLLSAGIVAPAAPGTWALVIDVVDDVDGSFAAHGSAPVVGLFVVTHARLLVPVG